MCERSFMLVIFLILKIIILFIIPVVLYYLYKTERKEYNLVGVLDIIFILLFIILRLSGNSCITNSSFSYIKGNDSDVFINESNDTIYETVYSTDQYTNMNNSNAYFYSIYSDPLRNVKLSCTKSSYMKNYGDSITAITTLISNYYGVEIDEMELINYLEENDLIDCEKGIDFLTVFKALQDRYYYDIVEISGSQLYSYILNNKSVLVETQNKYSESKNFGCEKDYIIIYSVNNEGSYSIINPNDKNYDYFCPSNTIGYGSIIDGNQNEKVYSIDDINSKALKYYAIEVRK